MSLIITPSKRDCWGVDIDLAIGKFIIHIMDVTFMFHSAFGCSGFGV